MAKKLRWISFALSIFFAFSFILVGLGINGKSVSADNSDVNIDYEKENLSALFDFVEVGDGYYISAIKGKVNYLKIPDYYKGRKVTGIVDGTTSGTYTDIRGVFYNQKFVKIEFGKNLEVIGAGAFNGCSLLTEIVLPDNVKRINHHAFYNCTSLTDITLPKLEYIGTAVFTKTAWYNAKMQEVLDRFGNKEKADRDIYYEKGDNVILLEVKTIKAEKSYTVKPGTRLIASQVFSASIPLGEIIIPDTVEHIGDTLLGPAPYVFVDADIKLDSVGCQIKISKQGDNKLYGDNTEEFKEFFKRVTLGVYTFALVGEKYNGATYIGGNLSTYKSSEASGSVTLTLKSNAVSVTKRAIWKNKAIKELIIPETVKYIGVEAFAECTNLEKITFQGNGQVIVDTSAFENCKNLTEIIGGENLLVIGVNAFKNCEKLNSVTFANATILANAFYGCGAFVTANQKEGTIIEKIGRNAFLGTGFYNADQDIAYVCDYIIKIKPNVHTLNIEKAVADYALCGSDLSSVTVEQNAKLGEGALSDCVSLHTVELNGSVSDFCFYNSVNLKTVSGTITDIGDFAFAFTAVDTLNANLNSLQNVGSFAFYNSQLKSIDINSATLSDYALFGTDKLETILASNNSNYTVTDNVLYQVGGGKIVCYPANCATKTITLNNVVIAKGAFSSCQNAPTLNGTISKIEDRAFYGANVIFNATETTSVGHKAFYNSKIESLAFTELTEIGEQAFNYCSQLQNLNLSTDVKLDLGVLKGTKSLKNLTISLNRQGVYDYTTNLGYVFGLDYFDGAESVDQKYNKNYSKRFYIPKLENVTVSSGNVSIGAFMGLKYLQSVTLMNGVLGIGAYSFENCSSLQSVKLSAEVTVVPNYAFNGCVSLKSLNSNEEVIDLSGFTQISEHAFSNCTSISAVNISSSLKASSIYGGAFANCDLLKTVNIYGNEFFNIDNDFTIYGNLFDNATDVFVGTNKLSADEIASLKVVSVEQKNNDFATFVKENKIVIICVAFIVFALLVAIIVPILNKKFNPQTVDEFGRPISHHKHKKHHHRHHHKED